MSRSIIAGGEEEEEEEEEETDNVSAEPDPSAFRIKYEVGIKFLKEIYILRL